MIECDENIRGNQQKERKEIEKQQTHEWGVCPPLSGEETSVNEIDSFPTQTQAPTPICLWQTGSHTHTNAFAHMSTRTGQQPEMKGINTLHQTSEESSPLPGGSSVIGPDKQPKDNNNKASAHNKCCN